MSRYALILIAVLIGCSKPKPAEKQLSEAELKEIMTGPNKSFRDYKNSLALIDLGARVLRMVGVERRVVR